MLLNNTFAVIFKIWANSYFIHIEINLWSIHHFIMFHNPLFSTQSYLRTNFENLEPTDHLNRISNLIRSLQKTQHITTKMY
jgi:hypothetical protein